MFPYSLFSVHHMKPAVSTRDVRGAIQGSALQFHGDSLNVIGLYLNNGRS
jgi:hypothetical protein